jgi:hypothetical protein
MMVSVCRLTWPTLESRQTQEEERLLAQHTSEQFSAMHSTNLRAHFVILPSLRQGPQVFHELDKSPMRIARLHDESRMTRRLATCNSLRRGIPIRGTKDRKPSIAHAQRRRHNSREKRGSHIFRRLHFQSTSTGSTGGNQSQEKDATVLMSQSAVSNDREIVTPK